jgi:hypothetical protein
MKSCQKRRAYTLFHEKKITTLAARENEGNEERQCGSGCWTFEKGIALLEKIRITWILDEMFLFYIVLWTLNARETGRTRLMKDVFHKLNCRKIKSRTNQKFHLVLVIMLLVSGNAQKLLDAESPCPTVASRPINMKQGRIIVDREARVTYLNASQGSLFLV